MDRKALKLPFTLSNPPHWKCPACQNGVLRIDKTTFKDQERKGSSAVRDHEAWEPSWIESTYVCQLQCDQCGDTVSSAGTGAVVEDYTAGDDGQPEMNYVEVYVPSVFEPHLHLFSIPAECPESVTAPLLESFKLFFLSPAAAANNVRISVEELLTELGVRRYDIAKNKRRLLSLHSRIKLLPPKHEALGDILLAMKWLGNAGSHAPGAGKEQVTKDDVLDLYEFASHVLKEIYAPTALQLKALAKKVNKKKGVLKKK